jgi:hypothetical protein
VVQKVSGGYGNVHILYAEIGIRINGGLETVCYVEAMKLCTKSRQLLLAEVADPVNPFVRLASFFP